MNNQLGSDENRQRKEESDMHFNVLEERKAATLSRRPQRGEDQQR
jgi:hypothetical protein